MKLTALSVPKAIVGEGPVWDVETQRLLWIDIIGARLWQHDPEMEQTWDWELPGVVGSMALRAGGGAIIAMGDGVYASEVLGESFELLASSPLLTADIQLADGKVDRRGRFIVGSMDRAMKAPLGKLFVLDPGARELRVLDDHIILGNGPCWSPDDTVFYHADSVRNTIYAYDYDIESGTVANRRPFADTSGFGGMPDGATVDSEGFVWSAICEGGKVVRFRPDGAVDRVIEMPVKLPGSVMFGGATLDRLFVPTLNPAFMGRASEPLDGSMFVIDGLGVSGVPECRFAG